MEYRIDEVADRTIQKKSMSLQRVLDSYNWVVSVDETDPAPPAPGPKIL